MTVYTSRYIPNTVKLYRLLMLFIYLDDVTESADTAGVGGIPLPVILLFLSGGVAFIKAGVALCVAHIGHEVDELLERRAQLSLLVLFQAVIQSLIDHDAQRLDQLQHKHSVSTTERAINCSFFINQFVYLSCFI